VKAVAVVAAVSVLSARRERIALRLRFVQRRLQSHLKERVIIK
jgi:hypothetical protein